MHDAGVLRAMAQIAGVPQFVNGFFDDSVHVLGRDIHARPAFVEPKGRDNAGSPSPNFATGKKYRLLAFIAILWQF